MKTLQYIILESKAPRIRSVDLGGPVVSTFNHVETDVEVREESLTLTDADDLAQDNNVRAIAPKMPMQLIQPTASPEVSLTDLTKAWGITAVKADTSPFDGNGVTVAVLDTGIDHIHPAFNGVQLIRKNFTAESDDDTNGHGTHCAGTIFGRDVGGIRIGVARGVKKALIGKVLGSGGGDSASITKAIQWAVDEGANIISMSLGIDFPGYVNFLVQQAGMDIEPATSLALDGYRANINLFRELASYISASGVFTHGSILIAAAGNESRRPDYEIAVAPPAASSGILSVGAVGEAPSGLKIASFSNTGVDVAGPGINIISAKNGGGLVALSGTSMAAPHTAGVAALWAQKLLSLPGGKLSTAAISSKVMGSCLFAPLDAATTQNQVGMGLVQAPQ